MTTKTEILTADEALKLYLEYKTLIGREGEAWHLNPMTHVSNTPRLGEFINAAPFRLAEVERFATYKDSKVEDGFQAEQPRVKEELEQQPHVVGRALWIQLCKFHESNFMANINEVRDAIVDLIRTEARKIAQEEIAHLSGLRPDAVG